MSIFSKAKKFLLKNSNELSMIVGVLKTLVKVLPIDRGDREKIIDAFAKLDAAVENIANASEKMTVGASEEDRLIIEEIVQKVLTDKKNASFFRGLMKG